jgi:hypothetical protein
MDFFKKAGLLGIVRLVLKLILDILEYLDL